MGMATGILLPLVTLDDGGNFQIKQCEAVSPGTGQELVSFGSQTKKQCFGGK